MPTIATIEAADVLRTTSRTELNDNFTALNNALATTLSSADCDGVHDEVQIQAAIDALTEDRTTAETLVLRGHFVVGATILVPSYTHIILDGSITYDPAWTYEDTVFAALFSLGTLN